MNGAKGVSRKVLRFRGGDARLGIRTKVNKRLSENGSQRRIRSTDKDKSIFDTLVRLRAGFQDPMKLLRKDHQLVIPTINVPGEGIEIAKNVVQAWLFRLFVRETGYEIEGYEADNLKNILYRSGGFEALTFVCHNDAQAFADWLSQVTGKKFRLPTDGELEAAEKKVGSEMMSAPHTSSHGAGCELTGEYVVGDSSRSLIETSNRTAGGKYGERVTPNHRSHYQYFRPVLEQQ